MNAHETLNHVAFSAHDLLRTKAFLEAAFGGSFMDDGPNDTAFSEQDIDGGFHRGASKSTVDGGGASLVSYSERLEETLLAKEVQTCGGRIARPVFTFPDGRRFHFAERKRMRRLVRRGRLSGFDDAAGRRRVARVMRGLGGQRATDEPCPRSPMHCRSVQPPAPGRTIGRMARDEANLK